MAAPASSGIAPATSSAAPGQTELDLDVVVLESATSPAPLLTMPPPRPSASSAAASQPQETQLGLDGFPNEPLDVSAQPAEDASAKAAAAPETVEQSAGSDTEEVMPQSVRREAAEPVLMEQDVLPGPTQPAKDAPSAQPAVVPGPAQPAKDAPSAQPAVLPGPTQPAKDAPSAQPGPAQPAERTPSAQPAVVPAATRPATTSAASQTGDELRNSVQAMESAWRKRLECKPRAVVGILCTDEQAANANRNALSNYAQAILRAGGSPRFIYMTRGTPKGQLSRSDALLIPGGIDVHPSKYGESVGPGMARSNTNPAFDDMEIAFIQEGWRIGMPMLGICRGMQIMNVAGGGTLVQDIPTEWKGAHGVKVNHNPPGGMMSAVHSIGINAESRLHRILGVSELRVNSVHHQCVGKLSDQLDVTAVAFDGVVEGVQRRDNPLQHGVQFHPEFARAANPVMARLLDDLVHHGERLKGTYYTTRG